MKLIDNIIEFAEVCKYSSYLVIRLMGLAILLALVLIPMILTAMFFTWVSK